MQLDTIELFFKARPFSGGFLYFVFTKNAVTLLQDRFDPRVRLDFGHSNKLRRSAVAVCVLFSLANFLSDKIK